MKMEIPAALKQFRFADRSFGSGVEPNRDAPGSMVRPVDGELIVLLDEAAASHLPVTG